MPLLIGDRLLDLFALLLLGAAGLGFGPAFDLPALLCLLVAVALAALIAIPGRAQHAIKTVWVTIGRPRPRLFAGMLSIWRDIGRMLRPTVLLKLLALSVLAWSMEALALHMLMPVGGGELPLRAAAASLGIANIAGVITPLPGGAGGQELTMGVLIGSVAENSTASTVAMVGIMRLSTLWYAAALGLPFFLLLSWRYMYPATRRGRDANTSG